MSLEDERALRKRSNFERELFRNGVYNTDPEPENRFYSWLKEFRGRIPRNWAEDWSYMYVTFERADEEGIQLSSSLVDAAISFPHPWLVERASRSQKLTVEQMVRVLKTIDPGSRWQEIVLGNQRGLGVPEREIRKAKGFYSQG